MEEYRIHRADLMSTLVGALKDKEYALAMWEGGAAGFDRIDEWSDADVQVIVKDGFVEQAFEDVEGALAALTETDYRYRLPEPTWHGHSQCFYRFKETSPYLMLDLVFIQQGSEADRFMQFRTHGQPLIWFDKAGLVVEEPLDIDGMVEKIKAAVDSARMRYDLFWILTMKEVHRKNKIEAFAFYYNFAVMPLLEVLRIEHCPERYYYRTRYPQYDLPGEINERLTAFFFVRDLADLEAKFAQAREWFAEIVSGLDWDRVEAKLAAD
jgi:hypothetical protein